MEAQNLGLWEKQSNFSVWTAASHIYTTHRRWSMVQSSSLYHCPSPIAGCLSLVSA